jgi:ElaB/YqjD/DUF883 family membrane-anchored ribosome-binding protein
VDREKCGPDLKLGKSVKLYAQTDLRRWSRTCTLLHKTHWEEWVMSHTPFGSDFEDTTEKFKDKVGDVASKAKERAAQWTNAAAETVNTQRVNAASGLERVASKVHDKAGSVPGGPKVVDAAHRLADGMEATAGYLRKHDLGDMRDDVVNVARRHPVQAIVSAVVVGFLLGRTIRR